MRRYRWDVAVFAANEAETIARCLSSINTNVAGHPTRVSVLLNGTTDHSLCAIKRSAYGNIDLAVFRIARADKANAINTYIYGIRNEAEAHFFVDGYVRLSQGAMPSLAAALEQSPKAVAATGVPLNGRSAEGERAKTLKGGALNGQFFALRRDFVDRLVAAGFRIPVGTYRCDALLGSMANHELDALGNAWDTTRILGVAEAGFELSPLSAFRWRDVKRQFRREVRQARGALENSAMRSVIYRDGYAGLPEQADELIRTWLATNPQLPWSFRRRLFGRIVFRELASGSRFAPADLQPHLVYTANAVA